MPMCWPPARASPLSFSRMRRYLLFDANSHVLWKLTNELLLCVGSHFSREILFLLLDAFTEFEASKATDHEVLTDFGDQLLQHLSNRHVGIFHELLIHQADVSGPFVHLAGQNLFEEFGFLAFFESFRFQNAELAILRGLIDIGLAD